MFIFLMKISEMCKLNCMFITEVMVKSGVVLDCIKLNFFYFFVLSIYKLEEATM